MNLDLSNFKPNCNKCDGFLIYSSSKYFKEHYYHKYICNICGQIDIVKRSYLKE